MTRYASGFTLAVSWLPRPMRARTKLERGA
jgi:hypothetical protein